MNQIGQQMHQLQQLANQAYRLVNQDHAHATEYSLKDHHQGHR
jgi:hypothetical protein